MAPLRNSRKTECGTGQSLVRLAVRAAPFALLRNLRKTECGPGQFLIRLAVRAAPFALLKRLPAALLVSAALLAAQDDPVASIQSYIRTNWSVLTRSNKDLAKAAVDPKFHPLPDGRWPVYVPRAENLDKIRQSLKKAMSAADLEKIELRPLPEDTSKLEEQGLLYLPYPYVVPGGRFNEMYGWDSYFIQVGLLRDGELDLAKDMAENFLYEIRNYGKILNANRTYYLGRSQPPFLTEMLLGVYNKNHDKAWLTAAIPEVEKYYRFWTTEPHLTPATGLSRYYDFGDGPAPEVLASERDDKGRTHYDLIRDYYKTHEVPDYFVSEFFDKKNDRLTSLFYKGDRSMRESGFDPSNRFGPFNVDIIHYNPVCLNSLLVVMERQTAEILEIVGRPNEAKPWNDRAAARVAKIRELMWDEKDGLFYDYEFVHKKRRAYPFLTTFYPLWAGVATKEQAARVTANLPEFEQPGGLQTSTFRSGNQWDAPFGWAPLELISVEGLRKSGFAKDADRVSEEFLSLVLKEFLKAHIIVEKYNVVKGGSDLSGEIKFGYRSNEPGFGWTNAAFNALFDALPDKGKDQIRHTPAE
jgi:alpha,alpha-trehalase